MEKNKNKNREPFPPENTPQPPQVMDTRHAPERDEKKSEESNSTVPKGDSNKRPEDAKGKKKLLGESPTEIDDETTI
jgi:hypothetical protein